MPVDLEETVAKNMAALRTPRCGYYSFASLTDLSFWEFMHPSVDPVVCERALMAAKP